MNLSWIVLVAVAHAAKFGIVLPPSENPADWAEELAMAGLVPSAAATGPRVEVLAEGERWRVRALDGKGQVREVVVAAPRDAAAREDVAFLAASLVRPMASAGAGPTTAPVATTPVTTPAPRLVVAKVAPPVTTTSTATAPTTSTATAPTTSTATAPTTSMATVAEPTPAAPPATEPVPETATPAVVSPESTVSIERAPRDWSLGAGISAGATVRVDTNTSPSLGVAARLDNDLLGLGLRLTWLMPSTVTGLEAAPSVGEVTTVLSAAWLPGDALLAAEGGASFLSVWGADGNPRGEVVAAPLVGARAGWRIRPAAGWAIEPFVGAEYLARPVSLLTVAEGKTTLAPARLRAGLTAYFSPGED